MSDEMTMKNGQYTSSYAILLGKDFYIVFYRNTLHVWKSNVKRTDLLYLFTCNT